jgi:hypothetical protein
MEGSKNTSIHDDHGCKSTVMTPKEQMKHLTDKEDSTHMAIYIYLERLNTSNEVPQGSIQPRI